MNDTSGTRISLFFFFNDTATTEIYTLSLHDALPISRSPKRNASFTMRKNQPPAMDSIPFHTRPDRKSTRLNSSHSQISYAVFCLKKKKKTAYQHVVQPRDTRLDPFKYHLRNYPLASR